MADFLTPSERSARMRLIRSSDTKPEKRLRSVLHRAGFRFRLHDRSLPGTPGHRVPESQEGDLRTWVFLASPQMSEAITGAEVEPGLLDSETGSEQETGTRGTVES